MGIQLTYFDDDAGEHRVRISGDNGEPMFTSEGYVHLDGPASAIQVLAEAFKNDEVRIVGEVEEDPDADVRYVEGEDSGTPTEEAVVEPAED
jgi:uncharacterized protein YegP (UPF0339 family)